MDQISADLLHGFKDEDTETWVQASIEIGRLGERARPLLEKHLASRDNIHRHRHAWCVLAAYVAETRPGPDLEFEVVTDRRKAGDKVEKVAIVPWLRSWVTDMLLEGLKECERSIKEIVSGLPGFAELREQRIDGLRREKEKLEAKGNEKGLAVKTAMLEAWESDEIPFKQLKLSTKPHWDMWVFSSFLAGVSKPLLDFLDIDPNLLVESLATHAQCGHGARLAFLGNLIRILRTFPYQEENEIETLSRLTEYVARRIPPPNISDTAGHWLNVVIGLGNFIADRGLDVSWSLADCLRNQGIPKTLDRALREWEQASGSEREDKAISLVRMAEAAFCRETLWREKDRGEQLSLFLYSLVMTQPGPEAEIRQWKRFTLDHRLQCVNEAISLWKDDSPVILEGLVRLLKVLLGEELRLIQAGENRSPFDACRRQVSWIRPLAAQWELRGILSKDVATIATRGLNACYEFCSRSKKDFVEYYQFLYLLLYQISERGLFKDMIQYAQNPKVAAHLEAVSDYSLKACQDEKVDQTENYGCFIARVMGEGSLFPVSVFTSLLAALSRSEARKTTTLSDEEQDCLRWMIAQKVLTEVDEAAGWRDTGGDGYQRERKWEVEERVNQEAEGLFLQAHQLAELERVLGDHAVNTDALTTRMRETLTAMRNLQRLVRGSLPMVESEAIRINLEIQYNDLAGDLAMLTRIFEEEDEQTAVVAMKNEEENRGTCELIGRWMLQRFMLRELGGGQSRIIGFLLDWRTVLLWILAPFIASALLHISLGGAMNRQIVALPFLLMIPANIALLIAYFLSRHRLPGGLSQASLLLPQMVATLFYGIMASFDADESWAMGLLGNPWIRLINLAIFLGASYFFVRYVMLSNQLMAMPPKERRRKLLRRTLSVLSLGLWQSFALITLFSLLMGNVMTSSTRANWMEARQSLGAAGRFMETILPHALHIDIGSIGLVVFPWAILIWTVRIFFFSAIFERIMNSRQE